MQSSFKFSWHFELIKSRTLVLKMDLSFLSLDQKYVGQKYGEISGKYSLPILCFLKKMCITNMENPHVLMFGQGENCLDLVILSLYQFLQLGWASPLLPPWIQTEPCLWWGGLGKVSLSTGEMWSVSQVIYFQIHITEKYNIVICSRISLWVYEVLVFSRIKKDKACSKLGYTSISEMLSVTWKMHICKLFTLIFKYWPK